MTDQPVQSMAQFVDGLLLAGITWEKLLARASAEAAKRGTATLSTIGMLRSHVKYRASQTTKWEVGTNKSGVRMNPVAQPAKAKPAPKKAKPNGKPVGRAVKKTNGNDNRQTVEPVADQPAPEQAA